MNAPERCACGHGRAFHLRARCSECSCQRFETAAKHGTLEYWQQVATAVTDDLRECERELAEARAATAEAQAAFEHYGWVGLKTHIVWNEPPKPGDEHLYVELFARRTDG